MIFRLLVYSSMFVAIPPFIARFGLVSHKQNSPPPPHDLVIRNGRIIDGTGNPAFFADLAATAGRIVAIGTIAGKGHVDIDAKGLVVAPGFIDVHTHAENIVKLPRAENFARMGVTSIVTGNCGTSRTDIGKFLNEIEDIGVSINVATLVGHNAIRSSAMGGSFNRAPTAAEMEKMKSMVDQAMDEGAVGLSTGLIYLPGTFSKTEEIIDLARIAARHKGIYTSHMRNEGLQIMDALNELIRVAREAHIRAEVSHIKLSGKSAWGRADQVLALIEKARDEGLDITQDQYMYTASSTGISMLIPSHVREGGREKFVERVRDPNDKAKIVARMKEILRTRGQEDYSYAVIASYAADPTVNGKSVPEATMQKRGSSSLDDQIDLILEIESNGGASGVFHGIAEDDLQGFLKHPNTMIASDSSVRAFKEGVPHPRGYGNNARLLARYVRELHLLRLEDAVRRMTSLPATTFRLKDRGFLREGYWADIVVLDPQKVQDCATFTDPHHYATGIRYVFVNGIEVVSNEEHTDARPGKALKNGMSK